MGWINEWINEWMNEWMYEWMSEWMGEWSQKLSESSSLTKNYQAGLFQGSDSLISPLAKDQTASNRIGAKYEAFIINIFL